MASTFTLTSHSYQGRYMYLECSQSKDIATNKSTISWKLSTIGGTSNYYSSSVKVTINGGAVYNSGYVNWDAKKFPAAKGSTSGTTTVDHDTYGNKGIWVQIDVMIYDGVSRPYGGTWTLDNIPRKATITSASGFSSNGNPPTVYFSNPAGNNVSALDICIADSRAWDGYAPYRPINNKTATSYTFTAEDVESLKKRVGSSATSLDVTFVIQTKIGETWFWSTSDVVKFTLVEDDTTKPSLSMGVSLNNGLIQGEYASNFDGMCIQGKSRLDVSLSANGKYSANITSYSATVDGKTYTSSKFTTDVINSSAYVQANAKDSRGFTGSASQQINNVIPYSKPLLVPIGSDTAIYCYRSDGNGVRVSNSTSVWLKTEMTYYSVKGKNSCALQWRMKEVSASWNGDQWSKLTTTDNAYNGMLSGDFDIKKSYTVQIRAIDAIGEQDIKTFEIPTQDVALHLGKGGKDVSIGTYCNGLPDYRFYSDWVGQFDKGLWGTSINFNVTDVLTFPEECTDGITPIVINASTNKENLPSGNYDYSVGIIHKRAYDQYNVILVDYVTGKIAINVHLSGTWTGWKYITPQ